MNTTPILRNIKSYVIRKGRMSEAQQRAVDQLFNLHASKQSDNRPFNTLFTTQQEQVLEIGFGMGTSLAEHAQMYPEINFIGIEVHPPGVGCLLNLINEHELKNVHVIQGDAVLALKTQCVDHSIARINIFFPDPWQKQRHHKRRLIQPEFVA
jgi:tRNA (guanine-N7-)-methyltransferase